jgi:outer membrane protein OmpA-like peptidoglycan-associated protein
MAMKYVKLFENWLLTEGEKVTAFDPNKPDLWPVLDTTVGDANSANMSNDFLKSIFSRALKEENRTKLDVQMGEYFPTKSFYLLNLLEKELETNQNKSSSLKKTMFGLVNKYFIGRIDQKSGLSKDEIASAKAVANEQGIANNSLFNNLTKREMQDTIKQLNVWSKYLGDSIKTEGKLDAEMGKKIFAKLATDLQVKLDDSMSRKMKEIIFYYGEDEDNELLKVTLPQTSQNKDEDKIIDYICDNISDYNDASGLDRLNIKDNTLTFGMIMAYLNKYVDENESDISLLSKTGKDNYDKYCALIFKNEQAADQLAFTSTVSIGGRNYTFASNQNDGTETPMFGDGKMLGKCTFAFNSFKVTEDGKDSITDVKLMNALIKAVKSIEIVGHTDSTGKEDYNQTLSEKRANSVLDVLKGSKDFAKIKAPITAKGEGETQPAKDDEGGKNKKMAALNRRIEFIIDGKLAFDYSKI